jgi:hypothetical protein
LGGSTPLSILFGNGDGTFSKPSSYPSAGGGEVALADLDRDGRAEALVASYQTNSLSVVWHLSNGGTSVTMIPLDASGLCVTAQDFNGDGATDVAVCSIEEIVLYLNGCP